MRLAAVQLEMRAVASLDAFESRIAYAARVCAEAHVDLMVLPEMVTLTVLSAEPSLLSAEESLDRLSAYTARYSDFITALAKSKGVNILAGSHIARDGAGVVRNTAVLGLRDGSLHTQDKLHPTPNERSFWGVEGGNRLEPIRTDIGQLGILICYDVEFPEAARHLVDQGAMILATPYSTDDRHGHLRVRYCAQARAVENQTFGITAGNVGQLRGVANHDINYAQSAILTPCDFGFARDGIAADAEAGLDQIIMADLDLAALETARESGTVRNLADRRSDLYQVSWRR